MRSLPASSPRIGLAAALLAALLSLVCDDQGPGTGRKPLDSDLLFSVGEGYAPSGVAALPRIVLELQTEKSYPCCNWSIDSRVRVAGQVVTVDVGDICVPEVCLTAIGPATATQFLDLAPGSYTLQLSAGARLDRYSLAVTDESLTVLADTAGFTRSQVGTYWRHPPSSFVYLCGTTLENRSMCDDFLDGLRSRVELTEFQFPGSGVAPYPRSSSGHYYTAPARCFLYRTDADFHSCGEFLQSYSREVIGTRQGNGISLQNWKNESYLSWLYTPR